MDFDAENTKNALLEWIRDWFGQNGDGCKDSSIAAALCTEALGRDRLFGVLMPNREQHDIDVAGRLTRHLGSTLYAVSQSVNGRIANTCNLSEDWVGYSTRYGDSTGCTRRINSSWS